MTQNNTARAIALYSVFGKKDIEGMEKYIHPDIQLISPLSKLRGKEAYLEAAKGFASFFNTMTIREKFGEGDQAMIVYDVDCPAPIGKTPAAALLTFQEELIIRIELFHDTSPYNKILGELKA